jgi:hypothetical protein
VSSWPVWCVEERKGEGGGGGDGVRITRLFGGIHTHDRVVTKHDNATGRSNSRNGHGWMRGRRRPDCKRGERIGGHKTRLPATRNQGGPSDERIARARTFFAPARGPPRLAAVPCRRGRACADCHAEARPTTLTAHRVVCWPATRPLARVRARAGPHTPAWRWRARDCAEQRRRATWRRSAQRWPTGRP